MIRDANHQILLGGVDAAEGKPQMHLDGLDEEVHDAPHAALRGKFRRVVGQHAADDVRANLTPAAGDGRQRLSAIERKSNHIGPFRESERWSLQMNGVTLPSPH